MSPQRLTQAERLARRNLLNERNREREQLRPHIAEWFGHRVFPSVAEHPGILDDLRSEKCPFLTRVAGEDTSCVKTENSRGVCTISAGSNGRRQDWPVCPHRALDDSLLHPMVRRLFGLGDEDPIHIQPVTNLADPDVNARVNAALANPVAPRQFVTFQQLFGGEISLPRSLASPELSFDVTVVELVSDQQSESGDIKLDQYGVIEIQTTDTHGTYKHAVSALKQALDLHGRDFGSQVAAHPDWPGRKIEGPNISNVFKRTFYQVMFKFQITRRSSSAGCVLALPRPVWDSWLPFLGAPQVIDTGDGTYQLHAQGDHSGNRVIESPSWIYVFDIEEQAPDSGEPTEVRVDMVIVTDAPTLSRLALETAPANAIGSADDVDTVVTALRRRIKTYLPIT